MPPSTPPQPTGRPLVARVIALLLGLTFAGLAAAEQKLDFDGYELHYVVIPTTFLSAETASEYGIVRAEDRALVNLSVLKDGQGMTVEKLSGTVKNLLSQQQQLRFTEVIEGDAVYYLAELKHSDRDTLTFAVELTPAGGKAAALTFQQKMYIR